MPQADVLSFHPTMLFLPVFFLGGYFVFVTRWVPRLLLTLKARAWLTTLSVLPVGFPGGPTGWPEIFLMFVQFGGLLLFVSSLTLVGSPTARLTAPRGVTSTGEVTFESTGGARVENLLTLWGPTREVLLFRPLATELTTLMDRVAGGLSFFVPGKQFPALLGRLRARLEGSVVRLTASAGMVGVDFINNCVYLKVVLAVGFGLAGVIFVVSAAVAPSVFNFDKSGSYECGFDPFEDARSRFDVRFYLVALLFIIFDLEVAFLFPLVGGTFPAAGVAVATVFLGVLTLGFVYEWSEGALQWS